MNQSYQPREGYWDYMGRRLREERTPKSTSATEELWMREVAEMQKQVHLLQIRIVELGKQVYDLNYKVTALGGDPNQLELKFNANL